SKYAIRDPASRPIICRASSSVSIAWTKRVREKPGAPDSDWPSSNTSRERTEAKRTSRVKSVWEANSPSNCRSAPPPFYHRIKLNLPPRPPAMQQNTDPTSSGAAKFDFSVKVKRIHPAAKLPARGTNWSAGADLCCLEAFTLGPRERKSVPTGLIVEIPLGWY